MPAMFCRQHKGDGVRPAGQLDLRGGERMIGELYATPKDVIAETRRAIAGQ
jgi:hypothetical protein